MIEELKLRWKQYWCYHYNKVPEGHYPGTNYYYCPDCGKHYGVLQYPGYPV